LRDKYRSGFKADEDRLVDKLVDGRGMGFFRLTDKNLISTLALSMKGRGQYAEK
jgi:hypothetical protein